jgi:hypothetical protein
MVIVRADVYYFRIADNTVDGTQNPSASSVKNVEWSTWTCPLGWPVQGWFALFLQYHLDRN